MVQTIPGLRARFFGHVFDSQKSQAELGWTDEQRKQVEKHLLTHRDFERHGGFYLEEIVEGKGNSESAREADTLRREIGLPSTGETLRCVAMFRNEEGDPEQCPNEVVEGDYCAKHIPAELKIGLDEVAEAAAQPNEVGVL